MPDGSEFNRCRCSMFSGEDLPLGGPAELCPKRLVRFLGPGHSERAKRTSSPPECSFVAQTRERVHSDRSQFALVFIGTGGKPMLRFQVMVLAALLSLGVTCGALAAATPEPLEDAVVKETRALLLKGDLRGFDALATAFRQSCERTPAGNWKLGLAYLSVSSDVWQHRTDRPKGLRTR